MSGLSFTEHPATVGESYSQHMRSAFSFSFEMICGGLACFLHGIFPFLFTTTGSSTIRRLHERMVQNRALLHGKPPLRPNQQANVPTAVNSSPL